MEMHWFSPIFYQHNTKPCLLDRVLLIITGSRSTNLDWILRAILVTEIYVLFIDSIFEL